MSNNKKSIYEKLFGSDDIYSDGSLDEMQKRESYGIAFKLFRVMGIVFAVFAMTLYCVGAWLESSPLIIFAVAAVALDLSFELLYAGFTSSRGIMPENFEKKNSGKIWIVWLVTLLIWCFMFASSTSVWYCAPLWILVCVYHLVMHIFARRNKKVRDKMLDE